MNNQSNQSNQSLSTRRIICYIYLIYFNQDSKKWIFLKYQYQILLLILGSKIDFTRSFVYSDSKPITFYVIIINYNTLNLQIFFYLFYYI